MSQLVFEVSFGHSATSLPNLPHPSSAFPTLPHVMLHAPCCPLLQPGPYKKRTDPWQDTQLKHFMRSFYSRTLDWLSQVSHAGSRGHALR